MECRDCNRPYKTRGTRWYKSIGVVTHHSHCRRVMISICHGAAYKHTPLCIHYNAGTGISIYMYMVCIVW